MIVVKKKKSCEYKILIDLRVLRDRFVLFDDLCEANALISRARSRISEIYFTVVMKIC